MHVDPEPLPDQAQESATAGADEPPARSGMSERRLEPTEAGGKDNSVHHSGRVHPKVTGEKI